MGESAPRLDGVEFGVLALGDTAYAEFCATGKAIDARAVGRETFSDDEDLGPLRMANTPFRLSATPPHIRWSGPDLGAHNQQVYDGIGIGAEELAKLRAEGVV